MKKLIFAVALFTVALNSCTKQSTAETDELYKNQFMDEVDRDKIERPGGQGGS